MNDALRQLARTLTLDDPTQLRLRLAFGHACALRVQHLLEDAEVHACLEGLGQFLAGRAGPADLDAWAALAAQRARQHPGSRSLDGCGHAAVSASHAVAQALAGRALQAADYAAYALVYGEGGYGAVADRSSFEPEMRWQLACLQRLSGSEPVLPVASPGALDEQP